MADVLSAPLMTIKWCTRHCSPGMYKHILKLKQVLLLIIKYSVRVMLFFRA